MSQPHCQGFDLTWFEQMQWGHQGLRRICSACLLGGVATLLLASAVQAQPDVVIVPRAESTTDQRPDFPLELLRLSLTKSARPYVLRPSHVVMPQSRSLRLLEAGNGIDVVWTVTSIEREQKLLPIRLPIDRGLIGWRLLLIRQPIPANIPQPLTLPALRQLRGAQGHDWPDLTILRANGFSVLGNPSYDGLFEMLARSHIDYFSRSLAEIGPELKARPQLNLQIEPSVVLHYPLALYYFVNKQNTGLAQAIETGLRRAQADGSWQRLFEQHFADAIANAQLSQRQVLTLTNTILPEATPLAERSLWFHPDEWR